LERRFNSRAAESLTCTFSPAIELLEPRLHYTPSPSKHTNSAHFSHSLRSSGRSGTLELDLPPKTTDLLLSIHLCLSSSQAALLETVLLTTPRPILESTAESGPHLQRQNLSSAWLQQLFVSSYRHTTTSSVTNCLRTAVGGKQRANRLVSCASSWSTQVSWLCCTRVSIRVQI
jgi:hypothetical protein